MTAKPSMSQHLLPASLDQKWRLQSVGPPGHGCTCLQISPNSMPGFQAHLLSTWRFASSLSIISSFNFSYTVTSSDWVTAQQSHIFLSETTPLFSFHFWKSPCYFPLKTTLLIQLEGRDALQFSSLFSNQYLVHKYGLCKYLRKRKV